MQGDDKKNHFPLRLPKSMNEKLTQRAKEMGVTKTAYILMLIDRGLKSA